MFQFYTDGGRCKGMQRSCFIRLIFVGLVIVSLQAKSQPPELQLANRYHPDITIQHYWVSEKLDGVRAYWDGSKLVSKQGNIYRAPAWFTAGFPDFPLDGELWLARNSFEKLSGIVRKKQAISDEWRTVTYQIFDLPKSPKTFDERLTFLRMFFKNNPLPDWLRLIKQYKVENHDDLMRQFDTVIDQGAEGLMLHLGTSYYHNRRDDELLKLKRHSDAEAKVISHFSGKGKYQGMLGSMLVEAVNKTQKMTRFKLGTGFSDEQRRQPPPVGSLISYKYFGLTSKGVPRFASFMRVRAEY